MEQIKGLLTEMFHYQNMVSLKFIELFESRTDLPEKALLLQAHLLNAHAVWISRILKQTPAAGPWDPQPVEKFRKMHLENAANTAKILEEHDLSETFTYKTFKGDSFTNTIQDA